MIDPYAASSIQPPRLGKLRALGALTAALLLLAMPTLEANVIEIEDPVTVERVARAPTPALKMAMQLSARSQALLSNHVARPAVAALPSSWSGAAPWLLALLVVIGLVPAIRRPVAVWQSRRADKSRPQLAHPQPTRIITPDMLEHDAPGALPIAVVRRSRPAAARPLRPAPEASPIAATDAASRRCA